MSKTQKTNQEQTNVMRTVQCALLFTFVLSSGGLRGQAVPEPNLILKDDDQPVFSLPEPQSAMPGSWTVGDSVITVERHEEMVKFQAVKDDKTTTQWVSDTDKFGRFVYNEKKHKFERLTHSVRVKLRDYDTLHSIIEETSAIGGKAFPQLGFATLNLPKEVKPSQFVREISGHELVESAQVVVEPPRQIPM